MKRRVVTASPTPSETEKTIYFITLPLSNDSPCSLISFQLSIGAQLVMFLNKQLKFNRNACIMLYKFKLPVIVTYFRTSILHLQCMLYRIKIFLEYSKLNYEHTGGLMTPIWIFWLLFKNYF